MDNVSANRIEFLIRQGKENDQIDFKETWHSHNDSLVHDILCFANTVHNMDCYIVFGVSDSHEIVGISDQNRKKQADVLELLNNIGFAGDYSPPISVDTIVIDGKDLDVLTIHNSFNVPFYIKRKPKTFGNIREGYIYCRCGDKNTPLNQNASMPEIELLWKKRFGLTLPPLDQIKMRMSYKNEWTERGHGFYNIYKPEYQLLYDDGDREDGACGEFYIYSQVNSRYHYYEMKIMFNMTVLDTFQLVSLDSGRFVTPVPSWGVIHLSNLNEDDLVYKYYTKDSFEYSLLQFLFDPSNSEQAWAKHNFDKVVLCFDDADEQAFFEKYVIFHLDLVLSFIKEADDYFFQIDTNKDLEKKDARKRLSIGLALNRVLKLFRNEK